jgi:hypothetical protein
MPHTPFSLNKNSPLIGVICAYNPRNSGMYTVDEAAHRYFSKKNSPFELIVTQGRDRIGGLRYRMTRDINDLRRYHTIVFWGDFLNNPMWGLDSYPGRRSVAGQRSTTEEWLTIYLDLKKHLPDTRIVVAGGCALGASKFLSSDEDLRTRYANFIQSADAVILRDPGSLALIQREALNPGPHVQLGFDCASLLKPFAPSQHRGRYFAHCFHRSLRPKEAQEVVRFVEELTGLRGIHINWLKNQWPRPTFHWRLNGQRALLRHAQFCISDIYHLSICSMNEGTPALCMSKAEKEVDSTLNESKKKLLFKMIDLERHHIEWTEATWQDELQSRLQRIPEANQDPDSWSMGFTHAQQRLRTQLDHLFTPARAP